MNLYDLNYLSVIQITGEGSAKFLQGQLTCNINTCEPNSAKWAAHCNPKGRVISLFYLYKQNQQSFYLIIPSSIAQIALTAFKKYAVFYPINLKLTNLHVFGTKQNSITEKITDEDIEFTHPYLANTQFILSTHKPVSCKHSAYDWQLLNLQTKLPELHSTTSEKFLPNELGLIEQNAIDFTKGCFTGQEIIARMHYRGKSKTKLILAKQMHESALTPGDDVFSGSFDHPKPCGYIVDTVQSKQHENVSLLLLPEIDQKNLHVHAQGVYFEFT